jgi:Mg2+ and Co2+ transporter CorA
MTFIAGLYGMNFDNLRSCIGPTAIFVVLAIMIIVAFGMLILFWRRGWIGAGPKKKLQLKKSSPA